MAAKSNQQGGGRQNKNAGNKKNNGFKSFLYIVVIAIAAVIIVAVVRAAFTGMTYKKTSYSEFYSLLERGDVTSVTYKSNTLEYKVKDGTSVLISSNDENEEGGNTSDKLPAPEENNGKDIIEAGEKNIFYTGMVQDDTLVSTMKEKGVVINGYTPDSNSAVIDFILSWIIPIAFLGIFMFFLFRRVGGGGALMGIGKSPARLHEESDTGVTFDDVAGEGEAKESLKEIVDFLHNPDKYTRIGARLPKGALLVGPPGTGKTLLAKAVAGEAKVPFFSISGSDFVEMFVGVGASRVRDLFHLAQEKAPAIIFIDEIDAIGKSRDTSINGNDEREQTLNQLLAEMDGFDSDKGLFILAATNRPEVLDKALLRPGRLDRRIIVDRPDLKGRVAILKRHAKKVKLDESVDLDEIAFATSGATGSDLANMINEAAILAVAAGSETVSQKDLWEAVETVIAGKEKKDRILSAKEKKTVACHETGHALVSAVLKNTDPIQKITIVPRTMGALGYVMQTPEEEKFLMTEEDLKNRVIILLSGRAAEEVMLDTVTTGASNDIEQATGLCRAMITRYGMSSEFGLMALERETGAYLDGKMQATCADATEAKIDEAVRNMLAGFYKEAKGILLENKDRLERISEYLCKNETITGRQFMDIFNEG